MSLILKETKDKKIKMHGLSINLPSVFIRFKPYFDFNGKSIESDLKFFESDLTWKNDAPNAPTNLNILLQNETNELVFVNSFKFDLKPLEVQSLEIVHQCAKKLFEGAGYECEIVL